jgi:hypothetical protein
MVSKQENAMRPVNTVQQVQVEALKSVVEKLTKSDASFASSLVGNFARWGNLSDKQMHWVETLIQRATAPKPAPTAAATVSFQPIQDLFDKAAQKLKRIKVKLQDTDGTPVVFSRAGAASKYAGQIMITDGKPFGENKFFGRIDTDGSFYATRSAGAGVMSLVQDFACDPAGTAGKYGRLTGGCSFCKQGLTDERSLKVGYGPVCAKHFGLAWG